MQTLIDILVLAVVIVVYYRYLLDYVRSTAVAKLTGVVAERTDFGRKHALEDIENLVTLSVSILMQAGLFVLLCVTTSFNFETLRPKASPVLLGYGALLGLAEMAFASFLGLLAMKITMAIAPAAPTRMHHWYVLANSGWMRLFNKAQDLLPKWQSLVLVAAYITVEELIYRGVVLEVLTPLGSFWAILISTLVFTGYQAFNIPTWRAAMFPVLGALVVGIVHGLLFMLVPDLWPLVVAHIVFFISVTMVVL